ncbi:VWA domain-containing protein [Clostridium sp. D2Q-11]|uniref:VWA domain-containing protein n=1 Tax=Anaeromonas frigoriresistens TaxID=2683708 RepID=A0A942Z843_9FIRM|nr:vWA domain-containing protein [Anaeromonas frigoriresistens]MBS4537579.1 VWA domain-containing protein [Anaeromonas frigoriresistens]
MEKEVLFKQIILVTDGESNGEGDPIEIANMISEQGITISTIGIIGENSSQKSKYEVEQIAKIGRGVCELTELSKLQQTMQMVTQKSIYQTIQTAVNKELKSIINTEVNDLNPNSREKIMDLMDNLSDTINLKCIILLDTSKSMTNKINIAKKSILSLLNILNSREGKSEIAVIAFPHIERENYKLICDFTEDISLLKESLSIITTSGMTPTAEALEGALQILDGKLESCLVL